MFYNCENFPTNITNKIMFDLYLFFCIECNVVFMISTISFYIHIIYVIHQWISQGVGATEVSAQPAKKSHLMYYYREREKKKKVNQSHYRPEVPRGFQEVKVPRICNNGPEW